MKTYKKTIEVYRYSELSPEAQEKVINDTVTFFLEAIPYEHMSEAMQKAVNKAEEMQTPWFTGSYIYEYANDEIMQVIESHTYTETGKIEDII